METLLDLWVELSLFIACIVQTASALTQLAG